MIIELYRLMRPTLFKHVVGQDATIKRLTAAFKNGKTPPHSLLFSGPTGTGKTTLGRIVAKKLGADEEDIYEVNCANENRGIDFVRELRNKMRGAALSGGRRVWILDECQQLTADAQDAALKLTEDTPDHCWLIFCSSDPHKLKPTFRTRLTEYKLEALSHEHLQQILTKATAKLGCTLSQDVSDRLIEAAKGSGRSLLVILQQIADLPDESDQIKVLESVDAQEAAANLAAILMNGNASWVSICKAIDSNKDDPEKIRRGVLGYCSAVLVKQAKDSPFRRRLWKILSAFRYDFFATGRSGLIMACYEVSEID